MFTDFLNRYSPLTVQLTAVLVMTVMVAALYFGGGQPFAVGLFAAPYDKLAHLVVFAALAVVMCLAIGLRGLAMMWFGFFCTLLVGIVDEWHQIYLPGRTSSFGDVAADAVGAALGAWAAWRGTGGGE